MTPDQKTELAALAHRYGLPAIAYDERLPVPPEILDGQDPEELARLLVFPVIKEGGKVVFAVNDPGAVPAGTLQRLAGGAPYELRVAPADHILWFIEDFLSDRPGRIIGTERTGLAFWRNTMANWRTRLACYRNDLAKARTSLGILRWGLGFITLATVVTIEGNYVLQRYLYLLLLAAGLGLTIYGVFRYFRIRSSAMSPPAPQTLIEVTTAAVRFLEEYQMETGLRAATKETMLARLSDFVPNYCLILKPDPPSRERTHLARERNVLAAQRTIAACYRTIYSRARTGLAFIRTGVVFLSIGVGLVQYAQFDLTSIWGALLAAAGVLMMIDGLLWYLPVRKEEPDLRRVIVEAAF